MNFLPRSVLASLLLLLAAAGCQKAPPADSPKAVVSRFFAAVAAGDYDTARAQLAASEAQDRSLNFDKGGLQRGYEVGEETVTGERALVTVTIHGASRPLTQVCVREAGTWRFSVKATMQHTTGFDPDLLERQMRDGLQRLGADLQKSVRDSVKDTLHAAPR